MYYFVRARARASVSAALRKENANERSEKFPRRANEVGRAAVGLRFRDTYIARGHDPRRGAGRVTSGGRFGGRVGKKTPYDDDDERLVRGSIVCARRNRGKNEETTRNRTGRLNPFRIACGAAFFSLFRVLFSRPGTRRRPAAITLARFEGRRRRRPRTQSAEKNGEKNETADRSRASGPLI